MPAALTHPTLARTRQLHLTRRVSAYYPPIEGDLAKAYHSLQLHWLSKVPGYREEVKRKVDEVAKRADARARVIESKQRTADGQLLGQRLREEQLERLAGY